MKSKSIALAMFAAALLASPALAGECTPTQEQEIGGQLAKAARDTVNGIAPVQGKQIFNFEKCDFGAVSKTLKIEGKYSYLGDGGLFWVTVASEFKQGDAPVVTVTGMSKNLVEAVRAQQANAPATLVAALP